MEKLTQLKGSLLKKLQTLFIVVVSVSLLSSCLKTYVDPKITASAHTVFVNTIPNGASYSFFIDEFRVSSQTISFSFALPAIYVTAGTKKVDLVPRNGIPAFTDTITFKSTYFYTIFTTQQATTDPEFFIVEDSPANLQTPPAGKAKVRFVNLSPDAPNTDLYFDGGANIITNLPYKTSSDFVTVDAGVFDFDFRETGTTTTKFKKHVAIESGRIYTVFSLGLWNAVSGYPEIDLGMISATN